MNVPNASALWRPSPGPPLAGARERLHVQGQCRHCDRSPLRAPLVAGTIGVHLNTESIRIAEVDRLAHQMISHASWLPSVREMRQEASERRAIGEQDRKVIEAEAAPSRNRRRADTLMELEERRVTILSSQRG